MRVLTLAAALAALASACGRPQWVVALATDVNAPAWGDRVLVEVLDDAGALACPGCRREFDVTDDSFPLTFGAAPPDGRADAALRVRARFYRAAQTGFDGLPRGTSFIDAVGALPPLGSGPTRVVLPLIGFCFGQPAELANHQACDLVMQPNGDYIAELAPEKTLFDVDVALAGLTPGRIDRFTPPQCPTRTPPDGMACVEAETFLLGSQDSVGVDTDYPPEPELVRRPIFGFFIDVDEMTVGAVRDLVRSGAITPGASRLLRRGDPGVPSTCTYLGPTDATNDALPINCISENTAALACFALDKALPSEAEWERAARNGRHATRYPWGRDPPTCDRAIVSADATCVRAGPVASGSPNDVSADGVRNLGGNLSEWVEGIFVDYTDECWNQPLDDSDCATDPRIAGWAGPWPYRGGSWSRRASSAASFARFASPHGDPSPAIGFRCAQALPF
jgi:formylglycine-generating enzyme required for sulfatase activity